MKTKYTIVFIDDDEWLTDLYGHKLKEEGFRVFIAHNGKDGVALVQKHKPDMVLTDVVMPKGDGFYVLQKIRDNKETKEIPVVTLTNISSDSDKEQCIGLGACAYLLKAEYTPTDVVKKIKKMLSKSGDC